MTVIRAAWRHVRASVAEHVDAVAWGPDGLVPVVAQDRHLGTIRMVAFADRAALEATLETGVAHFWSRSRKALWKKGESSGHVLRVAEVWLDCDGDAVLYLVDPVGPTCHTGRATCFFQRLDFPAEAEAWGRPTLRLLETELETRTQADASKSYTKALLEGGAAKIAAKLREEAGELGESLVSESDARVASEAADVTYHLLVGLLLRRVPFRSVLEQLAQRFGTSGIEEKASRSTD